MFEPLVWTAIILAFIGVFCALDGSRDVFHPLVFIAPMLAFIYGWMPLKLIAADGLGRFFDNEQLVTVQSLNVAGILAFVLGCLAVGAQAGRQRREPEKLTPLACFRLRLGGAAAGGIGLLCWSITIVNVGGFVQAFSASYSGGWDDSGYVRDGSLMLLVGVMLMIAVIANQGPRIVNVLLLALFALPWLTQALLTARRGPTFALVIVVMMSWYMFRGSRPPVMATAALGLSLGWLVLFLVANRGSIYLGSDFDVNTDVTQSVSASDTGNEFVYGAGSIISTERHGHYFWMRRYLAQILVRPIPSSIWETKYEDFGVPELLHNAGTGEGIADTLGWEGAVGSAPGIVADLFIEVSWGAVLLMGLLGCAYGWVWKKAVTAGPAWISQYVIISALSIYLVMQTMEAVIFRTLLLSIPAWMVWNWSLRAQTQQQEMELDEAENPYSGGDLFDSGSVHIG
jgi:oligosaccharide repeat unit polymerase